MAFGEAAMAHEIVTTDAPDLGPKLLQFLVGITKPTGFRSAARGVVLRIKKQHQGGAVAISDGATVAFVILQADGRSVVTNVEGHDKRMNWWRNPRKWG